MSWTIDDTRPVLRLGHSPDPDDAFMWWPLLEIEGFSPRPRVDTGQFRLVSVAEDIEGLNQRSEGRGQKSEDRRTNADRGPLEITAMSCAQYPFVQDRYVLTACGSSMGEHYGPKLVSRQPMNLEDLTRDDDVIAVPGERTSAFAMTCLMLGKNAFRHQVVPFEQIIDRVAAGEFAAGLIIHEGQLTYQSAGLRLIEDVGRWWTARTGLPMPLGVNAIRRDLEDRYGRGTLQEVTNILRRSVDYALAHRAESIAYALRFGRGLSSALADEFIAMYVNKWTLDFGPRGKEAVRRFFDDGHRAGLFPEVGEIDFIEVEGERVA